MEHTEDVKNHAGAPSESNVRLSVDAELIAFERICTDLLDIQESSRSRILKAVAILLELEI